MVLGVRVHGPDVVNAEVKLDETFRPVPIPAKLGIPVLFKELSSRNGFCWNIGEAHDGLFRVCVPFPSTEQATRVISKGKAR